MFSQNRGKYGPVFNPRPVNFAPTANPYIGKAWRPKPLGQALEQPQAASATVAGMSIGCCGDCASEHRNR